MKSASKAAEGEIIRKFLDSDQPVKKQAYSIRFTPCVEYDEKGSIVDDDPALDSSASATSLAVEEEHLKALLNLLRETVKLAHHF